MKFTVKSPLALLLIAASALALAGCASSPSTNDSVPRAHLEQCVDLPGLPTAKCGTITVPLDRDDPKAGTTKVSFALVPRTDQTTPSRGAIVPNPGGPGTSLIDLGGGAYAAGLSSLLKHRELLLIDPRGVGRSDALACASLDGADLAFASIDKQRSLIGDCGVSLGEKAAYYGTAAVADDFDDIRAALRIKKLDLLGDSYGTFLMATYADRHPAHVRSIVLSGAYAVNIDASGTVAAQALKRVITTVGEQTGAYDGAKALADLGAVARNLRENPRMLAVTFAGKTYPVVIDETALAGAVGKLFASSPDAESQIGLAAAAHSATLGDFAPIEAAIETHVTAMADAFSSGPGVYAGAASWATACHDYPNPFRYSDNHATRVQKLESNIASQSHEDFGPFSAKAWLTRDSFDLGTCLDWPKDPSAGTPYPADELLPDLPVLVLSGELDANTSSASGKDAAAQFPNARWVEVKGAGHTPSTTPEGQKLIADFISESH